MRNHYSEISKQCRKSGEAVVIAVNGRRDTVSIGYDDYNLMKSRIELLEILVKAEEDINAGRVTPMKDTFADLHAMLMEKNE